MIVKPDPYIHIRHRGEYSPYASTTSYQAIKLFPPSFKDGLCRVVIGDKETYCTWDELFNAVLDLKTLLPKDD